MIPEVSVVIPVYNAGSALKRSVSSVLSQTLENVEVVAVDDCSTDDSLAILRETASSDARLKVLAHDVNEGPLVARKDGVSCARGKYVLFLDADDALSANACERIVSIGEESGSDIIHFDMEVVNVGLAPQADIASVLAFAKPYDGELYGSDIVSACFEKHLYGWNLANKAFRLEICKKAHEKLPRVRLLRGEDGLAYFLLAYYAESYIGMVDEQLYLYYYGAGEDGRSEISLEEFRHMCSSSEVSQLIRDFLESQGALADYWLCYENTTVNLASHAARQFRLRVPREEQGRAFEIMRQIWGPLNTAIAFSKQYWGIPEKFARAVSSAPTFKHEGRKIRTIGTYYHHYLGGGTEKVQRFLISLWRSMGYRVVVFVDNLPEEIDADLEAEADVYYLLPEAVKCTSGTYKGRARALDYAVECSEIDLMVYHYYDSQTLLWDMTLLKSRDISTLVFFHNSFTYPEKFGRVQFAEMASIYALSDGVITLSAVDSMWWNYWGVRTFETVSPCIYKGSQQTDGYVFEKNILCLGRVAPDKHTDKVIDIFEIVAQRVPDATLTIVGGSGDKEYVASVKEKAADSVCSGSITMVDWVEDASRFFSKARVFLMASDIEGYPLALLESMASGVPVVMYDLPYLTIVRESAGNGVVAVPFDEPYRAAAEVEKLLLDDAYYKAMSGAARENAAKFTDYDFELFWSRVIESLGRPGADNMLPQHSDPETHGIMQQVFFGTYKKDLSFKRASIAKLEKKNKKLEAELKKYKRSNSWRIGRVATWFPRQVKKIVRAAKGYGSRP